jgi:hypothetical protein
MIYIMRVLVDIPKEQVDSVQLLAQSRGQSRAEVIRQAIDAYISVNSEPISKYFGLWAGEGKVEDARAYEDRVRSEWQR